MKREPSFNGQVHHHYRNITSSFIASVCICTVITCRVIHTITNVFVSYSFLLYCFSLMSSLSLIFAFLCNVCVCVCDLSVVVVLCITFCLLTMTHVDPCRDRSCCLSTLEQVKRLSGMPLRGKLSSQDEKAIWKNLNIKEKKK